MRCAEAKRLMRKALAGDATAADDQRLDGHVQVCEKCAGQRRELARYAQAVQTARPEALGSEADLTEKVVERLGAGKRVSGQWGVRARRLALAAAAAMVLGGVVWLATRSTDGNGLLSVVEAAMEERPRHCVHRGWNAEGKLIMRRETWYAANGDRYSEFEYDIEHLHWQSGRAWNRRKWNISWTCTESFGTVRYCLSWYGGGADAQFRELLRKGQERMSELAFPGVLQTGLWWWMGLTMVAGNQEVVATADRLGELRGHKVRIIEIQTTPSARSTPTGRDQKARGDYVFRYYLSADSTRLVGATTKEYDEEGNCVDTFQVWPIEYDVEPPGSLFELEFPAGAKITFEGKEIDALWEHMDEAGRQRIIGTVNALAEAWRSGDFEEFEKHYDFAAGLEYGVKGKFTAQWIRERWRRDVERQPERWAQQELIVDYGFGTCEPPALALSNWSIYRENPQSGDGWILYRQEPSTEPGIIVLARVKVTDTEGETRELGTRLFLKKIGGEYKVILWRPPFS